MAYKFTAPRPRQKNRQFAALRSKLISLAGLVGERVVNQDGQALGTIVDLVFRWDTQEPYPPLSGIIMKVAWRQVWIAATNIEKFTASEIRLHNAKMDMREFKPRPGEVRLAREVLDHQLIDVEGARVVRASDLYVATVGEQVRLVGVDVSFRSLFRRLGPRNLRTRPTPEVVIDWATIKSFGGQDTSRRNLRMQTHRNELRRLRPGELADLLEDLGRDERQEILTTLPADEAADVLEEMEPTEVEAVLRESTPADAGAYLSNMEPDEAADALRDIDPQLRDDLIANMNTASAAKVTSVLAYDEATAGGIMNTAVITASTQETVVAVTDRLKANAEMKLTEIDSLALVNEHGTLVYDLPLVELLLAPNGAQLSALVKPPEPVTVTPTATISQVAELLVESRRTSIVVVDENQHPLGRIFADDVVDALMPEQGRFHFPRILS